MNDPSKPLNRVPLDEELECGLAFECRQSENLDLHGFDLHGVENAVIENHVIDTPSDPSIVHRLSDRQLREFLLSAFIDDELDSPLMNEVNEHLAHCHQCTRLLEALGAVDGLVVTTTLLEASKEGPEFAAVHRSWFATLQRWLPLAVAASVAFIMASLFFWPRDTVNADEFIQPIKEVQLIQARKQIQQDLMLNVMDCQLKALRAEIQQLSSTDQDKILEMSQAVEELLSNVQSLQCRNTPNPLENENE